MQRHVLRDPCACLDLGGVGRFAETNAVCCVQGTCGDPGVSGPAGAPGQKVSEAHLHVLLS